MLVRQPEKLYGTTTPKINSLIPIVLSLRFLLLNAPVPEITFGTMNLQHHSQRGVVCRFVVAEPERRRTEIGSAGGGTGKSLASKGVEIVSLRASTTERNPRERTKSSVGLGADNTRLDYRNRLGMIISLQGMSPAPSVCWQFACRSRLSGYKELAPHGIILRTQFINNTYRRHLKTDTLGLLSVSVPHLHSDHFHECRLIHIRLWQFGYKHS